MTTVREHVLPQTQRWDLAHLTDQLDLTVGDRGPKVSAFWTMLTLSGVIAVAGVLADSSATVIGAMIIAPLSGPIMGIALGIVLGDGRLVLRSGAFVAGGVVVVIGIGLVASLVVPSTTDLLTNSQITGRTSPTLVDLIAAVATGLAGAVGLSRRDVSAVLPGVAIAISLVPPLGVVGVCAGQGNLVMALGAFVLFGSNVVALVLSGTFVFTAYGYAAEAARERGLSRRRSYVALAAGIVLVVVPLAANTLATTLVAVWTQRISNTAAAWIADVPGARITDVNIVSRSAVIQVESPTKPPDTGSLLAALEGKVPNGIAIVVDSYLGERIDAGVVGQAPQG
ncbi:MAG: TIGR00341 family protein [Cellulomonas sp.]